MDSRVEMEEGRCDRGVPPEESQKGVRSTGGTPRLQWPHFKMEHSLPALREGADPENHSTTEYVLLRRRQRLLNIGNNVIHMLNTDGQADHLLADARGGQFFRV